MAKTYSRQELYRIAVAQKVMCFVIVLEALSLVLFRMIPPSLFGIGFLVFFLAALTGFVFLLLFFIRVFGPWVGLLLGATSFIPVAGLLALLLANSRATRALRAVGIRVGLLGANLKEVRETPLEELTNVFE